MLTFCPVDTEQQDYCALLSCLSPQGNMVLLTQLQKAALLQLASQCRHIARLLLRKSIAC